MTTPWRFLLLALAALPFTAASTPAAEPVRFTGRVRTPDGAPLAGATAVLLPGHNEWTEDAVPLPAQRAPVDADGRFEVRTDAPRGRLGYLVVIAGPDDAPCAGWSRLETGRDLGDVRVDRACGLRGRILDAAGRAPLADTELRLLFVVKPFNHLVPAKTFRTDGDGKFALTGLAAGTYQLQLDTEAHQIREELILKGDFSVVEYRARKSAVIEGVVTDTLGRPVSGATVRLSGRPDAVTDAQGRYRFDRLPERYYSGEVTHPSFLPEARYRALSAELSEGAGKVEKRDLKLVVPGAVRLTLEPPAPGEPALDGAVRLVADVVDPNGRATGRSVEREVQVSEGRALVENLYPGLNQIKLAGDQRGDHTVRVTVEAGRQAEAVLRAPRVAPWVLTVRDPQGRPVGGAEVLVGVDRAPPRPGKERTLYGRFRGVTADDGRCVLEGLPAGRLLVRAGSAAFPPARAEFAFNGAAGAGGEIRLDAGITLRVKVADEDGRPMPGAQVTATARFESGDDLLGGFVLGSSHSKRGLTGADGGVEFAAFPRAAYTVRAEAAARVPVQIEGDAPKADAADAAVRLIRGKAVTGVVVNEQGEPVAGARVSINGPVEGGAFAYYRSAQADDEGRFRIEGVGPGRFNLTALAPRAGLQSARTQVEAGAEDVKLTLPPAKK